MRSVKFACMLQLYDCVFAPQNVMLYYEINFKNFIEKKVSNISYKRTHN